MESRSAVRGSGTAICRTGAVATGNHMKANPKTLVWCKAGTLPGTNMKVGKRKRTNCLGNEFLSAPTPGNVRDTQRMNES